MNNLEIMKELISNGNEILKTEHSKPMVDNYKYPNGSSMGFPDEYITVDIEKSNQWFEQVHTLLHKCKLNNLIQQNYPDGNYGNFNGFDLQLKNIKNLYELSSLLNNKNLSFKNKRPHYEKIILTIISSSNDWRRDLTTYLKIIGRDKFKETLEYLDDKKFLNFNTLYRANGAIYILKGENPITSEGEERLKYLSSLRVKFITFMKKNLFAILFSGTTISFIIAIFISIIIVKYETVILNYLHQISIYQINGNNATIVNNNSITK